MVSSVEIITLVPCLFLFLFCYFIYFLLSLPASSSMCSSSTPLLHHCAAVAVSPLPLSYPRTWCRPWSAFPTMLASTLKESERESHLFYSRLFSTKIGFKFISRNPITRNPISINRELTQNESQWTSHTGGTLLPRAARRHSNSPFPRSCVRPQSFFASQPWHSHFLCPWCKCYAICSCPFHRMHFCFLFFCLNHFCTSETQTQNALFSHRCLC